MFYHDRSPAYYLKGLQEVVGQTGIVWNHLQPWLLEVEQLRQQVGMAGANALNSGEFSPV